MDNRQTRMAGSMKGLRMNIAYIAGIAAVLLTACAVPGAAEPAVTVTEQRTVTVAPEPAQKPVQSDEDQYMMLLAQAGVYADRSTSLSVADSVCNALDDGYDPAVIALLAVDAGFTNEQAAGIVAAAIVVFCPWHSATR